MIGSHETIVVGLPALNLPVAAYQSICLVWGDIYSRQTRLQILRRGGDMELEGEIVDYALTPMAISADNLSAETKLTITIKVRFTNNKAPEESFEKTYSAFQTFDSSRLLTDVQDELCATMITELAENIYNDTVAKW